MNGEDDGEVLNICDDPSLEEEVLLLQADQLLE